ncbi:hypothetical protein ETB97_010613 [Aspergillus alliaceus]|uniref:Uncharacterized protein n=1 Tax=Petromyces alliaceus TaxID=209559 RepID=A0A8H5ZTL7_PETAA|nr:hypothetical protein ETB97_010613 [Aspergillus burnettii]
MFNRLFRQLAYATSSSYIQGTNLPQTIMTNGNSVLRDGHPVINFFAYQRFDVDGGSLYAIIIGTCAVDNQSLLHRPLHPGIYIAFDFIAFGAVFATTVVTMAILTPAAEGGHACRGYACRDSILSIVEFFGSSIALLNS